MRLTGRFNFRRTLTGKLVLQLEEEVKARWPFSRTAPVRRRWRDANVMDLTKPELRALVDLRTRPQFVPHPLDLANDTPATLGDEFAPPGGPVSPGARTEGRISKH